jgi:hypothetical protein
LKGFGKLNRLAECDRNSQLAARDDFLSVSGSTRINCAWGRTPESWAGTKQRLARFFFGAELGAGRRIFSEAISIANIISKIHCFAVFEVFRGGAASNLTPSRRLFRSETVGNK